METDPEPSSPDTLIRLTRGMCFGECPAYTVEVNGRGEVRFVGERYVAQEGEHRAQVGPDAVQSLIEAFDAAGHADLPRGLTYANRKVCSQMATDFPSATTVLRLDGFEKRVKHDHGCMFEGNQVLLDLEDEIDRVLNTARWIDGDTLGTG